LARVEERLPSISIVAQSAAALEGGIYASKKEDPEAGPKIQSKTLSDMKKKKAAKKKKR
jgi:hypothetical protein